jgi:hypothetical protein
MRVKKCFGRYGDTDLEYDIINPITKEIIGKVLKCTMLCNDFFKCKECYFSWWNVYRPRENKIRFIISKFMEANKLKFENEKFKRYSKKNKI